MPGGKVEEWEEFRRQVESATEDGRFELWFKAYRGSPACDFPEVSIRRGDALIKILLARFLAELPEERAASLLRRLLNDADEAVVSAAMRAYTRNAFPEKIRPLTEVLEVASVPARLYAVESLAEGSVRPALKPILALLASSRGPARLRILSALRLLPDPCLPEELESFRGDPDEGVRERRALALGACCEYGIASARGPLVKSLDDPSPGVRAAVLWSLRRVQRLQHVPRLRKMARDDPDSLVRREALLGLADFPGTAVVRAVLEAAVSDPERIVALSAEAALEAMPPTRLWRILRRFLDDPDGKVAARALSLFAELGGNQPRVLKLLDKALAKANDPRRRLAVIEAIGRVRHAGAVPRLEALLSADTTTAYAAMGALLRIRGTGGGFAARELADPRLPPILKQMVLKRLARSAAGGTVPDAGLKPLLTGLLHHENLNVRYLAAQSLAAAPDDETLTALAEGCKRESDPDAKAFLESALAKELRRRPERFGIFLKPPCGDDGLTALALKALAGAGIAPDRAREFVSVVFALLDAPAQEKHAQGIAGLILGWLASGSLAAPVLAELVGSSLAPGPLAEALAESAEKTRPAIAGAALAVAVVLRERRCAGSERAARDIARFALAVDPRAAAAEFAALSCAEALGPSRAAVGEALARHWRGGTAFDLTPPPARR